eukprot:TRINITY_DN12907_c0_g1_i2.p1 TRINITY_DN12907_c0_g1~~TRINITY_DN12907_c0_g1_i2.p1  ORF type:complete len:323 (-),score=81.32 TRINITY_DN12907_c0_g1_i2:48-992(-)
MGTAMQRIAMMLFFIFPVMMSKHYLARIDGQGKADKDHIIDVKASKETGKMSLAGDTLGSVSGQDYKGQRLSEPAKTTTEGYHEMETPPEYHYEEDYYTQDCYRKKQPKESFPEDYDTLEDPPKETNSQCLTPPCHARKIRAKFYIDDQLWDEMQKDADLDLEMQVEKTVVMINKALAELDNGGYEIQYDQPPVKLNTSDVKVGIKYKDRLDNNRRKIFCSYDIMAHTLRFQEAARKMPNINDVNIRSILPSNSKTGMAEENCVCQEHGHGCVIVLTIRHHNDWTFDGNIFTHEFGHALGAELHDDQFYGLNSF